MNTKGLIFSIEKTSLHDGPGLRTTVFVKGCPLHCLWCHNPESQSFSPELYYFDEKCVRCGRCVSVCPKNCHIVTEAGHEIARESCIRCGECVRTCPYSALEMKGEHMEADLVLAEVEKDRDFYIASGGGLTVSGGEPLSQFDFTRQLLTMAKERGIHTCLETSGYTSTDRIIRVKDSVDIFLYDYKESDPERHKRYTGVDNELILKNLYELDKHSAKIILRCPIIPGMNDRMEHLQEIAQLANKLDNLLEVNIMPYHSYGKSKSANIGREYPLEGVETVSKQQAQSWIDYVQERTKVPVKKE